jgi:hypothetical protein
MYCSDEDSGSGSDKSSGSDRTRIFNNDTVSVLADRKNDITSSLTLTVSVVFPLAYRTGEVGGSEASDDFLSRVRVGL